MRKVVSKVSRTRLPATTHQPKPYSGPSIEEVISNKEKYMPKLYTPYYKKPLLMVEGHLQYLWDHEGNRYLDLAAGISTMNVGHSHPRITKVIKEQADLLTHTSSIYMNQFQGEYSKMLC